MAAPERGRKSRLIKFLRFDSAGPAAGQGIMLGYVNSLVHAVMYTYYLLSIWMPSIKTSKLIKRNITKLQMVSSACTQQVLFTNAQRGPPPPFLLLSLAVGACRSCHIFRHHRNAFRARRKGHFMAEHCATTESNSEIISAPIPRAGPPQFHAAKRSLRSINSINLPRGSNGRLRNRALTYTLSLSLSFLPLLQIQFGYLVVHFGHGFLITSNDCNYPKLLSFLGASQNLFMIILFSDFYARAYGKREKSVPELK